MSDLRRPRWLGVNGCGLEVAQRTAAFGTRWVRAAWQFDLPSWFELNLTPLRVEESSWQEWQAAVLQPYHHDKSIPRHARSRSSHKTQLGTRETNKHPPASYRNRPIR